MKWYRSCTFGRYGNNFFGKMNNSFRRCEIKGKYVNDSSSNENAYSNMPPSPHHCRYWCSKIVFWIISLAPPLAIFAIHYFMKEWKTWKRRGGAAIDWCERNIDRELIVLYEVLKSLVVEPSRNKNSIILFYVRRCPFNIYKVSLSRLTQASDSPFIPEYEFSAFQAKWIKNPPFFL